MPTKTTAKQDTAELRLVKQNLELGLTQITRIFQTLIDQVDRILPAPEIDRQRELKKLTSDEWGDFIDGKTVRNIPHYHNAKSHQTRPPRRRVK